MSRPRPPYGWPTQFPIASGAIVQGVPTLCPGATYLVNLFVTASIDQMCQF